MSADTSSPRPPVERATIYDVASAAGVSHQTVSRLLKGYAGIRPETRARVERALEALDYRPNMNARSLKSGRSHRIGALIHETTHFGPGRAIDGAVSAARESGYLLDLLSVEPKHPGAVSEALAEFGMDSLAGLLVLAANDEMVAAVENARFSVPMVVHGEQGRRDRFAEEGMASIVRHLTDLGHQELLLISGPSSWLPARIREAVFEREVAARGLRALRTRYGDWSAASGYAAIGDGIGTATAVVAANDQMALGAMLALKRQGHRIPDDVSVTGMDDLPESGYFDPPLTTVRSDAGESGRNAVRLLISRIEGRPPPEEPAVAVELVTRSSVAAVRTCIQPG